MLKPVVVSLLSFGLLVFATCLEASPITQVTDFIPNGSRTGFNGFEAIPIQGPPSDPISNHYSGGAGPYTEGGISVQQVNGDPGNDIEVAVFFHPEGQRGWYPDGGDAGYTRITRSGGIDFDSVGFLRGSGSNASNLLYDLYDNSVLVLSGSVAQPGSFAPLYLGWSGGGFDEIRVRTDCSPLFPNCVTPNTLALDAIEIAPGETLPNTPVPEPASMLLVGYGLAVVARRRLKKGPKA
jgi:hypothetical protein